VVVYCEEQHNRLSDWKSRNRFQLEHFSYPHVQKCSGSMSLLKLHGLSPHANYTDGLSDRRFSAKLVPTLEDRGCRVVSATIPPRSLIFGFLDRSRYFLEIAPQLSSQGWVDPPWVYWLVDFCGSFLEVKVWRNVNCHTHGVVLNMGIASMFPFPTYLSIITHLHCCLYGYISLIFSRK
jgi:hypothetical protein